MYRNILLLICGLLGSVSLLHAQKLVKAGMGYSSIDFSRKTSIITITISISFSISIAIYFLLSSFQ